MSGLIDRMLGRRPQREQRAVSWADYGTWEKVNGTTVSTPEAALAIAAVYACVRVLGESLASLPLHVYQKKADGSRERVNHPISELLAVRPNPRMTAFEWREVTAAHLNLRGNAYTRIQRDGSGQIIALWPMMPNHVTVVMRPGVGLVYQYRPTSDTSADFAAEDVLHFKGLSPNGLLGYDPLTLHRKTLGHYDAAQQYGADTLENDATPGGVLSHPGELQKAAGDRVAASWKAAHGKANRGAIAILEEGMSFTPISITPENAQYIETLKLKRTDIAGIYRVPPHMIGDLDKATFSNIEHQDLSFAKHTLVPWCEREEQVFDDGLLTSVERERGYYIEHNLNAISRGDMKSRIESLGMMWDRGMITADEVRALENMNALPDGTGSKTFVPLNFVPAEMAGKSAFASSSSSTVTPPEPPEPPADDENDRSAGDDGDNSGQPRESRSEVREALWQARQGMQRAAVPTIEDAARRTVRRDAQNVRAAMKKRTIAELVEWLEDYFTDTDYAENQYRPAIRGLAEGLGPSMALEVDQDWQFGPPLRAWVEAYVSTMAAFHARGAMVQLQEIIRQAQDEIEAVRADIDERLTAWEDGTDTRESRAFSIANHEAHRFGGAFAVVAFGSMGVSQLVWRATGKSCEWCTQLDGTVVGIGDAFRREDDEMQGKDGATFKPSKPVLHPPLHGGCDCVVGPE